MDETTRPIEGAGPSRPGERRRAGERRRVMDLTRLEGGGPERREVVGLERRSTAPQLHLDDDAQVTDVGHDGDEA